MSGRFPNIRYQDSYDSFKYDDILKTEVYDYVKIRGDAGIVNQNISDLVVDGGTISKQGVKIGRAKVGGELVEANVVYAPEFAGTLSYNEEDDELVIIKKDGTAFDMLDGNVNFHNANISGLLTAGNAIIYNSLQTDTLLANSGNVVGDLEIGSITMNGFSVDTDGNVISKSINNSNGGIINSGSISGVGNLDGTGDLTMGTITMVGFSVDAAGNVISASINNSDGGITNTGSISNVTDLDGTGDLTMNTITMTGFSVDNNGDVITKSINNSNGGITNAGAITGATEIDVVGNVNVVGDIDGTGDLTMGTITMVGFNVDLGGNVTSASIDNSSGGITNTGSITGATDINASGNLVIGGNMLANGELIVEGDFTVNGNTTIINSENKIIKDHLLLMNYGNSTELNTHSGIIIANVENTPNENLFFGSDKDGVFTSFFTDSTANSADVNVGPNATARFNNIVLTASSSGNAINTDGDIHVGDIFSSNIDGTGDLTMDSITMTGFSVDINGNVVTASIDNSNGGIINVGDLIGVNDFSLSGNLITQGIDNNNTFIHNPGIISNIVHVVGNGGVIKMQGNNHCYMTLYPDGPTPRGGYIGYPNKTATRLDINNEIGDLYLIPDTGRTYITNASNVVDRGLFFGGTFNDFNANSAGIVSRIYETGTEKSEMVLFKFNDPTGSDGPDRIRLMGSEIRFDTYNTVMDDYANTSYEKMTIHQNGNVSIEGGDFNIKGGTLNFPVTSQYYPVETDGEIYIDSLTSPNATIQTDFSVTSDQSGIFINNQRAKELREYDSNFVKTGNYWSIYFYIHLGNNNNRISSRKETNFKAYLFHPTWLNNNVDFLYLDNGGTFQSLPAYSFTLQHTRFINSQLINDQKTQWATTTVGFADGRLNKGLGRVLQRNDGTFWMLYFEDGQDGSNTGYVFDPNTGKKITGTYVQSGFWFNNPGGTSSTYNTLYKVLPVNLNSGSNFMTDVNVNNSSTGYSFTEPEITDPGGFTGWSSRLYWTKGFYLDDTDGAFTQIPNPRSDGIPIGSYGGFTYSWVTGSRSVISGKNLNWMAYTDNSTGTNTFTVASAALNGIYPIVFQSVHQSLIKVVSNPAVWNQNYIYSTKIKICAKNASAKTIIYNNTYQLAVDNKVTSSDLNDVKLIDTIKIIGSEGTTAAPPVIDTNYLNNYNPASTNFEQEYEVNNDYSNYIICKIDTADPPVNTNLYLKEYENINVSNNLWNVSFRFISTNLFPSPQGKLVTPQLYINSSTDPVGTKGEVVLDQFNKLCFWDGSEWQKVTSSTWT